MKKLKRLACIFSCAALIMSALILFTQPASAENVSGAKAKILYEAGIGAVAGMLLLGLLKKNTAQTD